MYQGLGMGDYRSGILNEDENSTAERGVT
jgi:hypothetical protein